MLDFKNHAANTSLYNTPPCFAIYIVGLVASWLVKQGGLATVEANNVKKSDIVYKAIDQSGGFYRGHAQPASRSRMNIPFFTPSADLDNQFAKEAEKKGMIGLKGHRSVGGLRASTYNALPLESAEALAQFMAEFQRNNG
jgi:phosphoserine aminotransferase